MGFAVPVRTADGLGIKTSDGKQVLCAGPVVTNLDPADATVLSRFPIDVAANPQGVPSTSSSYVPSSTSSQRHEMWWKVTALVDDVWTVSATVMNPGVGNYTPVVTVWTGSNPASLTAYAVNTHAFSQSGVGGIWFEMPVTAGTKYWFQVVDDDGSALPANLLRLQIRPSPRIRANAGDIVIPSENAGFPASILDLTTGAIKQVRAFPSGEFADTLPGGYICTVNSVSTGIAFLDSAWSVLATVTYGGSEPVRGICSDKDGTFFVFRNASPGGAIKVRSYSAQGVYGGTERTLPTDGGRIFAVDRDGDIIYYASNGDNQAIHTFSFVSNAAGADLHAGFAGEGARDAFVAADGSVVFGFAGTNITRVRSFTTGGSIQWAVNYWDAALKNRFNHFCLCTDDEHLILWTLYDGSTPAQLRKIAIADGSVVTTYPDLAATAAEWMGSATPDQPWMVSSSCPIFTLTAPLSAESADNQDEDNRVFENAKAFIGLALIHIVGPD